MAFFKEESVDLMVISSPGLLPPEPVIVFVMEIGEILMAPPKLTIPPETVPIEILPCLHKQFHLHNLFFIIIYVHFWTTHIPVSYYLRKNVKKGIVIPQCLLTIILPILSQYTLLLKNSQDKPLLEPQF